VTEQRAFNEEPTRLAPVVPAELAARRARQRERGEAARHRDYDRMQREVGACEGECLAPGSTRGGIQLGDGTRSGGMVAVDSRGNPLTAAPHPGEPFPLTRPCFDCNRPRWDEWQSGTLASRKRAKPENAEDRAARHQDRRRRDLEDLA
jgi:hypothetical protein